MRKKIVATIISVVILLPMLTAVSGFAATEEEIEDSIALGLHWLASQQYLDGHWGSYNVIAKTGLAVLKLIDYVKEVPDIDSWTDPDYVYHSNVSAGLDFLFREGYSSTYPSRPMATQISWTTIKASVSPASTTMRLR